MTLKGGINGYGRKAILSMSKVIDGSWSGVRLVRQRMGLLEPHARHDARLVRCLVMAWLA